MANLGRAHCTPMIWVCYEKKDDHYQILGIAYSIPENDHREILFYNWIARNGRISNCGDIKWDHFVKKTKLQRHLHLFNIKYFNFSSHSCFWRMAAPKLLNHVWTNEAIEQSWMSFKKMVEANSNADAVNMVCQLLVLMEYAGYFFCLWSRALICSTLDNRHVELILE